MSNNKIVLKFLNELHQNNNKLWMDDNRDVYNAAKACWLQEVQNILTMLGRYDGRYTTDFDPKQCISRITNNRMYNPNLPLYKNYFTFSIMDKENAFSPLHVSVGVENSFVGCGFHNPDKTTLKNIRDEIDYDGQTLDVILNEKKFKSFFGGLSSFLPPLKTSPKGYAANHEFVEYLRHKSFIVSRSLTEQEVIGNEFLTLIEQSFVLSTKFRGFLLKAIAR